MLVARCYSLRFLLVSCFFVFNDTATTEIYTLSLHDALPISSERQMAYENAQVGIATAAFYPHITLSGSGGFTSRDIASLVSAPSAFWSLGGDLLQPIFEGGRNRANLALSRASYDESVANYRESVLEAFQQVEDGLSGLALLQQAAKTQEAAVTGIGR